MKHDFVHSDLSQTRIADRHGINAKSLRARAKEGGWVRLVGTKSLRRGPTPKPPGTPKPTAAQLRRRTLVARLLDVLDRGLTQLEARMQAQSAGESPSAADIERDARSLTGLMRIYGKIVELEEQAQKRGEAGTREATEAGEDAESFRRDLALRLHRLNQARDT